MPARCNPFHQRGAPVWAVSSCCASLRPRDVITHAPELADISDDPQVYASRVNEVIGAMATCVPPRPITSCAAPPSGNCGFTQRIAFSPRHNLSISTSWGASPKIARIIGRRLRHLQVLFSSSYPSFDTLPCSKCLHACSWCRSKNRAM
jgi:hypothetical protein